MKPKKCKKFLLVVRNSGLKETDGFYEVAFYGNKHYTFCFLRHEKHFNNPVSGVAVVHPNETETFNELVGCKLALVRAVRSFVYTLPYETRKGIDKKHRDIVRFAKDYISPDNRVNHFLGKLTTLLINEWQNKLDTHVWENAVKIVLNDYAKHFFDGDMDNE